MAIKWSDLVNKTREVVIEFQGECLTVTYRVNVVTPAFLQEVSDVEKRDRDTLVWQLNQIVESWDLLGDDGQPLEPDVEVLKKLPVTFLASVITAISNEMKETPGNDAKKD